LQTDLASTPALTVKKQIKSRLQCARRMQNIFWPTGRRLRLAGIKTLDGTVVSCPKLVQTELINHWKPIYEKKPIDLHAANTLLEIYGRRHNALIKDFRSCTLPSREVFGSIIKRVKDSAVGPDGIPYSAYSANIETSSIILEKTTEFFATEEQVSGLDVFNKQFVWFPPKGELDEDSIAIIRTAGNLRTIFGSNSDSKLIASGISDAISTATFAITPNVQRGFCRGRQLSLNVVDIDAYMRAHNQLSGIKADPDSSSSSSSSSSESSDIAFSSPTLDDYAYARTRNGGLIGPLISRTRVRVMPSSSTSLDSSSSEARVQPAGSISDGPAIAASESQGYKGNISDIPAAMLYDFCNAFPTLLHEWMWLVLTVLQIPKTILKVIECLYTSIKAFSSGVGDGSFLFEVFGGVRTGCPLSSILFLLCCNPFIDLMLRVSDGPKLSVTRICADDFGSALKSLNSLKYQAPIFDLAARCAGLLLKPAKCVLIITILKLTPLLIQSIRNWLAVNVPQFSNIVIAESGKFLGWHLGRHAATLSFAAPIKKYANRVHEICNGKSPAAVAVIRYNQRVVPVLSYVSQFAVPPDSYQIQSLAHRSLHSILRMPPNSLSRNLINSVGFCTGINPLPIRSYCASVRYRFAVSEAAYLEQLRTDIFDFLGDQATLDSLCFILPHGGIKSPCILQSLHDALAFRGPLDGICDIAIKVPEHQWIITYPISPMPSCHKGIQTAILKILSLDETCSSDLSVAIINKMRVTFRPDLCGLVVPQSNWYSKLDDLFKTVNSYLRVCWLKAIGGAWTTTVRMHEGIIWPCIFGCIDCKDEICHYLLCPVLWQLAREALLISEDYFSIGHRLCLIDGSHDKLRLLAYTHTLYHSLKNDTECRDSNGLIKDSQFIQQRSSHLVKAIRPFVA